MGRAPERRLGQVNRAIGKSEAKMHELLRSGKAQEAYNVWKVFPERLRTPETDQQIRQLLEQSLPPDFQPEP